MALNCAIDKCVSTDNVTGKTAVPFWIALIAVKLGQIRRSHGHTKIYYRGVSGSSVRALQTLVSPRDRRQL